MDLRGSYDPVYYSVINPSRDIFPETMIILSDITVNFKYLRLY